MTISTSTQTKAPFSLIKILSKIVPESVCGRTFFWGSIPSILLLFTIGVSFFSPSVFSAYLPFFALIGGLICLRWKSVGLGGCFLGLALLVLGLYREIPVDQRFWQMGLVFSLAIDFFILLLAVEEIDTGMKKVIETSRKQASELNQSQLEWQHCTAEWKTLQKSLEEEIEQLKEEAEQRVIEKEQTQKRIELIQSEIELLTSQKAYFVAEAKKGQQRGEEQRVAIQEELEHLKEVQEAAAKKELESQKAAIQEELTQLKAKQEHVLQEKLAQLEAAQESAFQQELAQLKASQESAFQEKLAQLKAKQENILQEELTQLKATQENVLQEELAQLKATQERVLQEKQAQLKVEQEEASQPPSADQRKLEGMLKQLRMQFDEKSHILSQTRKDLFATESKLLALKHEQELRALSPERDGEKCYETALNDLVDEVRSLEEERTMLEELVSHVLSQ